MRESSSTNSSSPQYARKCRIHVITLVSYNLLLALLLCICTEGEMDQNAIGYEKRSRHTTPTYPQAFHTEVYLQLSCWIDNTRQRSVILPHKLPFGAVQHGWE